MSNVADNKNKAIFYMILSAFAFTVMQVFIKLAINIPVFEKVFFRNFIGLIVTIVILKRNRLSVLGQKENRKLLWIRGLLGVGGVVAYFYSASYLPMADAAIINKTNPFFVTLFAWWFLKEKLSRVQIPALIITFIGAMLVIRPQFSFEALPAIIGFAGAIFMGGAYNTLRLLKEKEHAATVVFYFCLFSTVIAIPFLVFNFVWPNTYELLLLLGIGLTALIGQYAITYAYRFAPAAEISIYNYTSIIIAVIFGIIIWNEVPDIYNIIGAVLIIGVAIVVWRYNKKSAKITLLEDYDH